MRPATARSWREDYRKQAITPDQVRHWKARDRKNYVQHTEVMGASAATAAACANMDVTASANGWEWLHLISFQMGGIGNYPQLAENLVAGTYDANSEMSGIEEAIKKLVLDFGVTLTVSVHVFVVPGTHVGRDNISYDLEYKGKTAHFEFAVRSLNRPFSGVNPIWLEHLRSELGLKAVLAVV